MCRDRHLRSLDTHKANRFKVAFLTELDPINNLP